MSQKKGFAAETLACDYLLHQGLHWRASNFRTRAGEIDLIMQDGSYIVFVEVRARTSKAYGDAIESITYAKCQKILRAALYYLQRHGLYDRYMSRFDVVTVQGNPPTIEWIKHAIEMDELK
ncbi:MAG TPA: YraN family protein [Legionellaceae bacterium]|nr:YraN family protein [Legionellaceae bacterium]